VTIDKQQFDQHLFKPESSFEVLLRGHLWVESLINRILEIHMLDLSSLDLDRMTFRQKIDVAQAFGFIAPEDGNAFRKLNRLRNKLAHNLKAAPSKGEIDDLVNALGHTARAAFDAQMKVPTVIKQVKESELARLRYWFASYAMYLDYSCARQKYELDNQTKLIQVAAVQIAAKMYGGKEIPIEEARKQFGLADPPSPHDTFR
jgi:hypothetical protein